MMINSFTFSFDEVPLAIADGVSAGFVNGTAEIEYSADGEFDIINITLEGEGRTGANGKRYYPQVDAPPVIAAIIDTRLHKEWLCFVQDAVREQIASDREDAAEQRADARRDARMGL